MNNIGYNDFYKVSIIKFDISKLKIGFGNGTRQAGGVNRGILFEGILEEAFK